MAGKADYYADGQWNFYCDFCGAKNKSLDSMKTWSNYRVCQHHKEVRNPQDFVRGVKDNQSVPWTRPLTQPIFVGPACYLWDQSAYTGLAAAGCSQAGYAPLNSPILYAMKFSTTLSGN